MTKTQAYRILSANGSSFVANVIANRGGRQCARRLVKLATLAQAGQSVSFPSFSTSSLLIDGMNVRFSALDAAKLSKGRVIWAKNPEFSANEKHCEEARAIVAGPCPKCGGKIVRNLALTGWHQCESKECNFQVFTE